MDKKYVKVMFNNKSLANNTGFTYKIDEINVANNWNPKSENPKEMGGFNFSTQESIIRWLVRGDTLYDVIIPDDAEVIQTPNFSTPHGVFRTNKIIVTNPRIVTDEMAMQFYLKSNIPENSYFKTLAGCVIRGYMNTAKQIVLDKITKKNLNEATKEYLEFFWSDEQFSGKSQILEFMKDVKSRKSKFVIRKIVPEEFIKLKHLFPDNDELWEIYKNKRMKQLQKKEIDVFVISTEDVFVGEISANYVSHNLETETIPNVRAYFEAYRINKQYQGSGLGQQLLFYAICYLKNIGYTEFTIGVEDDNNIAKHIYEKYGFTQPIDHGQGDEFDPCEYTLYLKSN